MASFTWPPQEGNGNISGVPIYPNIESFPAANSVPPGTLGIAADTDTLYASDGSSWQSIASPGAALSIGAIDSEGAPSADAATISSNQLIMQSASDSAPGVVNNTTQSFSGNKTFTGTIGASNLSGTNTGDVTLTAVGSSPSANGATLSGQALTLQPADGTHPGLVSSGTQTIGGNKTFTGTIAASNLSGTNTGDQTITLTGDVTGSGTGSFATTIGSNKVTNSMLAQMGANTIKGNNTGGTANAADLTITQAQSLLVIPTSSAPLPLNAGGTGVSAASANAAFNALSPMTTSGDVIYGGASGAGTRLAKGSDGQVLTLASGLPSWAAIPVLTYPFETANLGLATSVSANALTIALKQSDGSTNPAAGSGAVLISMRSSTLTSGGYNLRSATSAASIVVPSSATLGQTSAVEGFVYVYAIDNSGTIELAVSGSRWDTVGVITTTTISSGATSLQTMYSTTGRSSVPYRLIGRLRITEATAGTWASNATEVDLDTFNFNEAQVVVGPTKSTSNAQTANGFTTITSSPTLTFTATKTGKYKIYTNLPLDSQTTGTRCVAKMANTSGSATVVVEQQNMLQSVAGEILAGLYIYSIYYLTAGTSYSFDAQINTSNAAGVTVDGSRFPFSYAAQSL